MKDQRAYFEKTDFQSDLPKQFLIMFVGIVLVLLKWDWHNGHFSMGHHRFCH